MQPQNYYPTPNRRFARTRGLLISLLVIAVLAVVGYFVYNQMVFRVSGTDPKANHMAAASAFINIYFNKPISPEGVKLDYSSPFISQYSLGNNFIHLEVQHTGMTVGKRYTITIQYVASTDAKVIRDKKISFVAQNIQISSLSKDQQSALVSRQDQYPYQAQYINYVGFDTLLDNGLSTEQMTGLKEDLFGYSRQVNQKFWTMTLLPGSLSVKIHDASTGSFTDTYSFKVKLGDNTLTAQAAADPINDELGLQLLNNSGTVVYDSANAHD